MEMYTELQQKVVDAIGKYYFEKQPEVLYKLCRRIVKGSDNKNIPKTTIKIIRDNVEVDSSGLSDKQIEGLVWDLLESEIEE